MAGSAAKNILHLAQESRFFSQDLLKFACIEPKAAAVEALIDANIAETTAMATVIQKSNCVDQIRL